MVIWQTQEVYVNKYHYMWSGTHVVKGRVELHITWGNGFIFVFYENITLLLPKSIDPVDLNSRVYLISGIDLSVSFLQKLFL